MRRAAAASGLSGSCEPPPVCAGSKSSPVSRCKSLWTLSPPRLQSGRSESAASASSVLPALIHSSSARDSCACQGVATGSVTIRRFPSRARSRRLATASNRSRSETVRTPSAAGQVHAPSNPLPRCSMVVGSATLREPAAGWRTKSAAARSSAPTAHASVISRSCMRGARFLPLPRRRLQRREQLPSARDRRRECARALLLVPEAHALAGRGQLPQALAIRLPGQPCSARQLVHRERARRRQPLLRDEPPGDELEQERGLLEGAHPLEVFERERSRPRGGGAGAPVRTLAGLEHSRDARRPPRGGRRRLACQERPQLREAVGGEEIPGLVPVARQPGGVLTLHECRGEIRTARGDPLIADIEAGVELAQAAIDRVERIVRPRTGPPGGREEKRQEPAAHEL